MVGTCTALPALGTDSVSNSMEMKEIKGRGGKVKKKNLTCGKSNEKDTENMMVENKRQGVGI